MPKIVPLVVVPLAIVAPVVLASPASAHHPAAAQAVGIQVICGERVTYNVHDIINSGVYSYGLYAVQARAIEAAGKCAPRKGAPPAGANRAEIAVRFALAQVGDRYVLGATGPNAWDCSSLIQAAYRQAGVSLPRVSSAQARAGRRVPLNQIRRGDIVVYRGHVALALGNGQQVAARNPRRGVSTQPIYRGALYGVRVV